MDSSPSSSAPPDSVLVFHAHIYYESSSRPQAVKLQEQAQKELADCTLGISRLIDRAVGPHPVPMFEINFLEDQLAQVFLWIHKNRGELSVLIHRDVKPEIPEHTNRATWLGTPLKLDLTKLDVGHDDTNKFVMGPGKSES